LHQTYPIGRQGHDLSIYGDKLKKGGGIYLAVIIKAINKVFYNKSKILFFQLN